jgi:hypothetical protein
LVDRSLAYLSSSVLPAQNGWLGYADIGMRGQKACRRDILTQPLTLDLAGVYDVRHIRPPYLVPHERLVAGIALSESARSARRLTIAEPLSFRLPERNLRPVGVRN